MKGLTKNCKIYLAIMLALIVIAVVFVCVFGPNTFGTLGNGQQLIYKVTEQSDDYSPIVDSVKDYLKDNKINLVSVQTRMAGDDVDAILFTFNGKTDLNSTVTIGGVECAVETINSSPAGKVIIMASIAIGSSIVLMFAYLALRYMKNNWLANSLGFVIAVLLNMLTTYAIVQIAGVLGFQYDSSIMMTAMYVLLFTALLFVLFTITAREKATFKKVSIADVMEDTVKSLSCNVLVIGALVVLFCVVLSCICKATVSIVLIPVAIATVVTVLSGLYVVPEIWYALIKKDVVPTSATKQIKEDK